MWILISERVRQLEGSVGSLSGFNNNLIAFDLFLFSVTVLRKRDAIIDQKYFINEVGEPSGPVALPTSILSKVLCNSLMVSGVSKRFLCSVVN